MAVGWKLSVALLILVVLVIVADAGRSREGKRNKSRKGKSKKVRPFKSKLNIREQIFNWKQTISDGDIVSQRVYMPKEKPLAYAFNRGDRSAGVRASQTLYDFTSDGPIAILRPMLRRGRKGRKGRKDRKASRPPCIRRKTTQTYLDMGMSVKALREAGESTTALPQVRLDATGEPLSQDELRDLYQTNPEVRRRCFRSGVVDAVVVAGDTSTYEGEKEEIKVVTYDEEVTLTIRGGQRRG